MEKHVDVTASADIESAIAPTTDSSNPAQTINPNDEAALLYKQDLRILPLCAAIYFLCFLDRSNIGNAKILNSSTGDDLQHATHMTDYQFNIALMVFVVAYAIFEVPSNILLKKLRPSRWLAFLMFSWGAITTCLSAGKNFSGITALRFVLGIFEAGLFPGLVYYITFWYRHSERSVRVAVILASATLAGAFGGAIAYGIGHMNGLHSLRGWQWLFIIEGIPSCFCAILVVFLLPDYPETASWLNETERDLARRRLLHEGSKGTHSAMTWADAKATLTDWRLYGHYAIYFAVSPGFSSLSLFSPSIVAGLGYHDLKAQLMTVPPWAVAYVCQLAVAYSADRFNARGLHAAGAATVGALGFIVSASLPPTAYHSRYGGLILATAGAFSSIPPLLGWLSSNMYSTAATGLAIAINVSIGGGLGQIPDVWIYRAEEKGSGYPTGHWTNAACQLFVAVASLGLWVFYQRKNARMIDQAGRHSIELRLFKL